jgi:hypothetical protein
MSRLGNARTIADIEFVIDAPSPGTDRNAWTACGVDCARDRHRFSGQTYGFAFEVLHLRFRETTRTGWHLVIVSETWRFEGARSEPRATKSLKLLSGKAADVLSWMRHHRSAKLQAAEAGRHTHAE